MNSEKKKTPKQGQAMTISPERLRELIAVMDDYGMCGGLVWHSRGQDTASALRELEQARTSLEGVAKGTHVIVPRGFYTELDTEARQLPTSTEKSDYGLLDWMDEDTAPPQGEPQSPEKEPAQENGNG